MTEVEHTGRGGMVPPHAGLDPSVDCFLVAGARKARRRTAFRIGQRPDRQCCTKLSLRDSTETNSQCLASHLFFYLWLQS